MPFLELKQKLATSVADHFKHPQVSADSLLAEFTTPPNIAMGHLALPCFRVAKLLSRPPYEIAKDLAAKLSTPELTVTAAGPYANFRWSPALLYARTANAIHAKKDRYGSGDEGKGKKVVVEYCSPNIAKKLAFHHIRSTLIGNTLANIYDFLGYETERINFVGDWGSQFARLLAAVELWGDRAKLTLNDVNGSMDHLLELYVRFHKDIEIHPELGEKASDALKKLESQEARATELWQLIRDISVTAMDKTLARMNIRFDHVEGESTYIPQISKTLELVKAKAPAKISEGAWIVEVPGLSAPALIQKKDGTTLYLTRDIAAALDRKARFNFDRMFYVVSEQQKLHFQLLGGVLGLMGYDWAKNLEHLSFGTVLFGSEKMSTREGRVVVLDELLDEAKARALVECTEKNPSLANKEEVAEQVGLGAVIFGELSAHRGRDIEFDWKSVMAFDGETGPYVQYSLVRCHSLLDKAKAQGEHEVTAQAVELKGLEISPEEEALILTLSKFQERLHDAVRDNEPYHLTHYLIDLTKAFNRFYYRFPVLQATDASAKAFRLSLVKGTGQAIENGLKLLGMGCPKEM